MENKEIPTSEQNFSFPKEDETPEDIENYEQVEIDEKGARELGIFHPDLWRRFGGRSLAELKWRESSSTPKERFLESQETSSKRSLGGGANETDFVEIRDDGSVVFKPVEGENENLRTYAKSGTYYRRERAAYLVSRVMGFDLVPTTVIREIDGKLGSVQEFIPDAQVGYDMSKDEEKGTIADNTKLWIFDYLIFNSDRHGNNYLHKDGKIFAIDNGLSFAPDSLRRPDLPKDFSTGDTSFIAEFQKDEKQKRLLEDLLLELLDPKEVDAFFSRLDAMVEALEWGPENAELLKDYK